MVNERFSQRLWISFGIIVASIAVAGGALYFFSNDLAANAQAIVSARARMNAQNSAVANLASLEQQDVQAAAYQNAIDQLLPDQYGLVNFAQWFSKEGAQYNVNANASLQGPVTPSRSTAPGNAVFSFTVSGSLSDIASFMHFVSAKSSKFLVTFGTFNITSDGSVYDASGQGMIFSQ